MAEVSLFNSSRLYHGNWAVLRSENTKTTTIYPVYSHGVVSEEGSAYADLTPNLWR